MLLIKNDLLTQAKQREHLKICIKVCSVINNNLQLLFSATDKKWLTAIIYMNPQRFGSACTFTPPEIGVKIKTKATPDTNRFQYGWICMFNVRYKNLQHDKPKESCQEWDTKITAITYSFL